MNARVGASVDHAVIPGSHGDQVFSVVESDGAASATDVVLASWKRSARAHHLSPEGRDAPRLLTEREVRSSREPLRSVLTTAQEEIDRLYAIVRSVGYIVLVTNDEGVAVHHRASSAEADRLKEVGLWLGAVWSESAEGTNGIGTALVEQRPVSVHRDQHFRTRHVTLSCAGAPVFGPDGQLVAVLDSSTMSPRTADHAHAMALAATTMAARAIEERLFREHFRRAWIMAAVPADDNGSAMLLAVDTDRQIVGADRVARSNGVIGQPDLEGGLALSAIFDAEPSAALASGREDAAVLLTDAHGAAWHVLVTPPARGGERYRTPTEAAFHSRPRIGTLSAMPAPPPPPPVRGGLPPALARRVREYIEVHLSASLGLETLASTAGLSVHHFARAFRQSVGVPPHAYVLQRRIERAQAMLGTTDLSLSEIALSLGFSDHSHFARHFRRLTGMTPSASRKGY